MWLEQVVIVTLQVNAYSIGVSHVCDGNSQSGGEKSKIAAAVPPTPGGSFLIVSCTLRIAYRRRHLVPADFLLVYFFFRLGNFVWLLFSH